MLERDPVAVTTAVQEQLNKTVSVRKDGVSPNKFPAPSWCFNGKCPHNNQDTLGGCGGDNALNRQKCKCFEAINYLSLKSPHYTMELK